MKKIIFIRFVGNLAMGVLFVLWVSHFAAASVQEKWETTGALAAARSNHTAISLPNGPDSMILIVGGTGPSGPLNSAELYDPQSGTFNPTGSNGVCPR